VSFHREHLQAVPRLRTWLDEARIRLTSPRTRRRATRVVLAAAVLSAGIGCGASLSALDQRALITSTELSAKAYCSFDVDAGVAARGLIRTVHASDIGILRRNNVDAGSDIILCP
jgi:hypothetical protein